MVRRETVMWRAVVLRVRLEWESPHLPVEPANPRYRVGVERILFGAEQGS